MAFRRLDQTSPAAVRARAELEKAGILVWVHDRFYGLVADAASPHGYRVVGSAESLAALASAVLTG